MLKLTIIVASLLLLTVAVPWPWALIPALALAPLAPLLCSRSTRRAFTHPDWRCLPENMEAQNLKKVTVDPALLIGKTWLQAELWMPFDKVDGERFRGQQGMMRLAAAIALTDECIDPAGSVSGCTPEEIAEWENSLNINRENIRRQNPKLDDARVSGFPGVIVMEGTGLRAYFVGSPSIMQACHLVQDGTERPLTAEDRNRLIYLPSNTLCYATGPVVDGKLGALCYLGAVRPVKRASPSVEALQAGQKLHRMGIIVCLSRSDRWSLETVRQMGIEWPEDEGSRDVLELIPRHEGDDQTRDFAAPVLKLIRERGEERYYRLLVSMFGLLLWPAATLCGGKFPFLLGLGCLCAGILLSREISLPRPPEHSNRSFLIPLIPGVLLPMVLHLFFSAVMREQRHADAGAMLCVAEASIFTLYYLSILLYDPRGMLRLAAGAAICLIGVLAAYLTLDSTELITLLFGFLAGMLCGVAVLVSHRYLASGSENTRTQ